MKIWQFAFILRAKEYYFPGKNPLILKYMGFATTNPKTLPIFPKRTIFYITFWVYEVFFPLSTHPNLSRN